MNLSSTVLSEGAYRKDRHHWNTGGHLFNIANCSYTLMDSSCIMKPLDSKWWLWVNLERLVFWQGLASRCDYLAFRWIIFTITWTPGGENFGLCLYAKSSSHTHGLLISHCCIHCFPSKHLKSLWDKFIIRLLSFVLCDLGSFINHSPDSLVWGLQCTALCVSSSSLQS